MHADLSLGNFMGFVTYEQKVIQRPNSMCKFVRLENQNFTPELTVTCQCDPSCVQTSGDSKYNTFCYTLRNSSDLFGLWLFLLAIEGSLYSVTASSCVVQMEKALPKWTNDLTKSNILWRKWYFTSHYTFIATITFRSSSTSRFSEARTRVWSYFNVSERS